MFVWVTSDEGWDVSRVQRNGVPSSDNEERKYVDMSDNDKGPIEPTK